MRKHPNLILTVLLLVAISLGALQGNRVRHLRESEQFYRWIVSVAYQVRLFEEVLKEMEEPDAPKMMDQELLDRVVAVTEPELPDISSAEEEVDSEGKPYPKLVRFVREGAGDELLWDLARSDMLAAERIDFQRYRRERRLATLGTQFDPGSIYTEEGAVVSISNMFFGFRKMAANLLWLQVDKYWHQGMLHRMVPLMTTTVTLDPNFIDAFLIGAWHLSYNYTAKLPDTPEPLKEYNSQYDAWLGAKEIWYYKGADFLKDGIRKNPRNYKLYFDLGFGIYEVKLEDHPNAVRYLSEAIRHRHDRWARRTLYRSLQNNGQYQEALEGWKDYISIFPDNVVAPRFIKYNEAMVKECQAEGALARAAALEQAAEEARQEAEKTLQSAQEARNAGNEKEADELYQLAAQQELAGKEKEGDALLARTEGKQLYDEARAVWEEVLEMTNNDDGMSECRIARMDALELIKQERYHEAIAKLEFARWAHSGFEDEAMVMIIDLKNKAGFDLSFLERRYELEREEAERVGRAKPVTQFPCRTM